MEFYQEILINAICSKTDEFDPKDIVESTCYQMLLKIRSILDDDTLSDASCFQKIEAIVCAFEEIGSSGRSRHDFG